jgi:hypothetical protein
MNKQTAIQVFAVLAILVGLLVSYTAPVANSGAIWGMVQMFLGYAIRDLFTQDEAKEATTQINAPEKRVFVPSAATSLSKAVQTVAVAPVTTEKDA